MYCCCPLIEAFLSGLLIVYSFHFHLLLFPVCLTHLPSVVFIFFYTRYMVILAIRAVPNTPFICFGNGIHINVPVTDDPYKFLCISEPVSDQDSCKKITFYCA